MQKWGIVILLCLPQLLVAQGQGLQIGLQGGIGGRQAGGDACTWSPEGGLGLRYLARWRVAKQTQLGLYAGVGATCSSFRLEGDYSSQFSRQDYLGNTLEYTTSAHAQEQLLFSQVFVRIGGGAVHTVFGILEGFARFSQLSLNA